MTTVLIPIKRKGQIHIMKIDYEDWQKFKALSIGFAGSGYLVFREYRKGKDIKTYIHRKVMNALKGQEIDHMNRDKLDNRKSNLRFITRFDNMKNKGIPKTNTSGFLGVTWHKQNKKWQAQLNHKSNFNFLGTFLTKEEAALAYNKAAIEYIGKDAYQNEVNLGSI